MVACMHGDISLAIKNMHQMKLEVITFESVNNEIYDETKLECMNVSPRVNDSISMTTAAPGTARYRKHTAGRRRGGDSSEPARGARGVRG